MPGRAGHDIVFVAIEFKSQTWLHQQAAHLRCGNTLDFLGHTVKHIGFGHGTLVMGHHDDTKSQLH